MRMRLRMPIVLGACALLLASADVIGAQAHAQDFVAGTTPSQRPAGAPHITTFEKSPQWYATARTGISDPLPPSLHFLENQGAWFTPFIHPGMAAPYDIRGWHTTPAPKS